MAEQKLDTLFYELEARSQQFDAVIDRARNKIKQLSSEPTKPVVINVDAKSVDASLESVKKKAKDLPGVGTAPAVVKVSGDVAALEAKLETIKDAAKALGMTSAGKPLVAKLDADIAAFSAKVVRAKATAEDLERKPITAKLTAQTTALDASLKKTTNDLTVLGAEIDKALGIEDATAAAGEGVRTLGDEVGALAEQFGVSGSAAKINGDKISAALSAPTLAAGALAVAVIAIGSAAVQVAADFDTSFRSIEAALPSNTAAPALAVLRDEIVALSTQTPRTVAELSRLAKQLADLGESDPAQIASDLNLIALSADALGTADASGLVELLDSIADSFQLTGRQSREALTQILSLSKGKISIEDLSGAFGRGATSIARFTTDAVGAAKALTVLIDANITSGKLIPGVLGILEQSEQALVRADQAAAAGQDGTARALKVFAGSVNKSKIESQGLLPVLADLYNALGGSAQNFAAAGLSGDQFTIAMRASQAVLSGAAAETETLRESMDKLQASAAINRGSADALAQLLKNDLAAALNALGSTFLPPVLDLMNALANRFNEARRNAIAFSDALPQAIKDLERLAQIGEGPLVSNGQLTERGRQSRQSVTNALPGATALIKSPTAADGLTADELAKRINAYGKLRDAAAETNAALNLPLDSANVKTFNAAIEILAQKIAEAGESEGKSALSASAAAAAKSAEELADEYKNQATSARAAEKAAKEMAERFTDATRSSEQYAAGLGTTANPLRELQDRQANLAIELDRMIAKLPASQQAAARIAKGTILDQLAEGAERVRQSKGEEITANIASLLANISGDAIEQLNVEYDALIDRLTKTAEAAEALDTEESRIAARRAREAIPLVEKERDALKTLEAQHRKLTESTKTLDNFQKQSNANYRGAAVTIDERNTALADLKSLEEQLSTALESGNLSVKARTEYLKQLKEVQDKINGAQGNAVITETKTAAQNVADLGSGLANAAQSGLVLVQVLGQGNSKLASMLAGVASIGKGISDIGQLAQKAGGFGALFSTGAGAASAIPAVAAAVGGLTAFAQATDLFGTKARERARQLREAAVVFNAALDDFLVSQRTSLEQAIKDRIAEAEALRQKAAAASGVELEGDGIKSSGDIKKQIADLNLLINTSGNLLGTRDTLIQFRDALVKVGSALDDRIAELEKQNALEIEQLTANLNVRKLALAGMSEESIALRQQIDLEAEVERLQLKYGAAVADYIIQLREVTAAEQAAAAAARVRAKALSQLDDELAVLGGSPLEQLKRSFARLVELFPELAGLSDDLKLSTQDGLATFQERLRDLFRDISADGISADEQPLVDAIKRMLGVIQSAVDALPAPLDAFAAALEAFSIRAEVFGLSAAEQLEGLAVIFAGKFTGLDDILGSVDLTTGEGRDQLKTRIQDAIAGILDDGVITDKERPFLEALQRFFGLINGVIDDATADAEQAASDAAAIRRGAIDKGNAEIAVRDLTGADAFKVILESLGPAFTDLFGVFDLSTAEGVEKAKVALWDLLKGIDDGTISLEQFGGMTRDEVIAAILGLDGALDGLKTSAEQAAEAAKQLAEQQESFTESVDSDFLRASGKDREADIAALKADIAAKVARAKELGLSDSVIQRIIDTGTMKLAALNTKYDQAEQRDAQTAADAAARESSAATSKRSEFIASAVTQISGTQALRITDYLASSLIEQRSARIGIDQLVTLMAAMVGRNLPSLSVPALPPGVAGVAGGAGGSTASVGAGFSVIVNVYGPITGVSPEEAGRKAAEAAVPYLNAALARAAGIEAKNQGKVLS